VDPAGAERTGIDSVEARCYRIPLDEPESDGTATWDSTSVVLATVHAGRHAGLGFTYGPTACATVVADLLAPVVAGSDAMDVPGTWERMVRAVRNAGRPGVVSMAISAVDVALWDLKARLLDVDLASLLGRVRQEVPVYGSGGFCSLSEDELAEQLGGWVHDDGIPRVKMKIADSWGRDPGRDLERIAIARQAI
jgi:L-alanine-DL-glutamate epimerase-like enolase superfamily enzyme